MSIKTKDDAVTVEEATITAISTLAILAVPVLVLLAAF